MSTIIATKIGFRGLLKRKGGFPTFIGPRARTYQSAFGRNAIPIGGGILGTGYLIDKFNEN